MERIYLGLGTNLGDKLKNLSHSRLLIADHIAPISNASAIYTTAAWGVEDQDSYLNQVVQIETNLAPLDLLAQVLEIEQMMGRERRLKWGARVIDIDILFYGSQILETEHLIIPHPFLQERNFVLIPMAELTPEFKHPISNLSMQTLKRNSKDLLKVEVFLGEEE